VLVMAAHPDDEVLGCGATMANHVRAGDDVHVVILGEGTTSRSGVSRSAATEGLRQLGAGARRANEILGVNDVTLMTFPDNRMDAVALLDVVKAVEEHVTRVRPDVVYTHHAGDVNVDHNIVHRAVMAATRPVPGASLEALLFFEVQSSTEWQTGGSAFTFSPNWFEDVSETLSSKLRALEEYESEMRAWPHSRSIRAVEYLARWRGATIGVNAAEAFMLGRRVRIGSGTSD
jgi:LmbE family N-acetylglucosaminyl deacetylase